MPKSKLGWSLIMIGELLGALALTYVLNIGITITDTEISKLITSIIQVTIPSVISLFALLFTVSVILMQNCGGILADELKRAFWYPIRICITFYVALIAMVSSLVLVSINAAAGTKILLLSLEVILFYIISVMTIFLLSSLLLLWRKAIVVAESTDKSTMQNSNATS